MKTRRLQNNIFKVPKQNRHPSRTVRQASLSFKNECDINCSNTLLGQVHKAKETKPKISKWNLIKFISFFSAKESINKTKGQPKEWEKISANDVTEGA